MTHAGGRPTILTPDLMQKAFRYVFVDGQPQVGWKTMGMAIPTIENFALYLGISRETVYAWERENPEFSDIVEAVRQDQASMLVSKGLDGSFNSTIAKLLLSSKHGYVEQSATDVTSKGEKIEPGAMVDASAVDAFVNHIKHDTSSV